MSDIDTQTEAGEQDEELKLRFAFRFYPEQGDEEDEDGMVTSTAVMQTVAFGAGTPKVMIDLEASDDDEHDVVLAVTVGDMSMLELKDMLLLVTRAVDQALEQQ